MPALSFVAPLLGVWYRRLLAAEPVAPEACVQTVPLLPVEQPGRFWQRHRHSLALQGGYAAGPDDWVVVNETKQQAFRWGWRSRRAGLAQVWVPSRYAELVNRQWAARPLGLMLHSGR